MVFGFVFKYKVLLSSLGWTEAHYVNQDNLELIETQPTSLPSECILRPLHDGVFMKSVFRFNSGSVSSVFLS